MGSRIRIQKGENQPIKEDKFEDQIKILKNSIFHAVKG
jgi:hypothetical protein